uniref:PLAT domain-containing protein n=1 Tax=Tetradesmus obliquus TaxID=3088 RepID=A0A383W527_TETOB|eukprot:jgi/Sobl393_1/6183/SZX72114.1
MSQGKRAQSGRAAGKPYMTYWSVDKWGMPASQLSSGGRQPGSLQEPSAEVLDGLNDLEQRMRATLGALASFNEDERMLLLRQCRREEAAAAQQGRAGPPGLLTTQQLRHVWRSLGLKISREQAAALFLRHGCDAQGLLPYEVFAAKLQGSPARLLALEPEQKGPYPASGGDSCFKGKISYRLCRKPVFPPSYWDGSLVANSARLPKAGLALEWVYGYNASNTAPNAFYTSPQKIVYYVAALGVVYDPATHTQQFFQGHDDDITCLALHPSRSLVATGQVASALDGTANCPFLHVWDATSSPPASVQQIDFPAENGDASGSRFIVAMAFSPCGQRLVVVTGDNRHTVSVFAWRTKQLLHQGVGHNGQPPQVYGVVFNPFMPQGASMFVTYGVKHIKFWISAVDGLGREGFTSSHGKFQAAPKADVMSAAFLPSQWLVTGSPTGELLLWDARAAQATFGCCCQVVQAHGPGLKMPSVHDGQPVLQGVRCLALRCNNTELVSCGSDGRICIHDITGDKLGSILQTLQFQHPAQSGPASFRALDVRRGGSELLLGTHCCDLWELDPAAATGGINASPSAASTARPGSAAAAASVLPEPLIQGHTGDVWGVAYHPLKPHRFVTACESNSIFVWHGRRRQLMAQVDIGMPSHAVDFSSDGAHLAVGGTSGAIKVLNAADMNQLVAQMHFSKEAIDDLKYSPDCSKLAAGSHDNFIDIFDVKRNYSRIARCSGHSRYVRHLDWSANSKVVQSSCGAYELLYFDAATGKQVQQNQRDTAWASYTNVLGFSVMGIWPDGTDGTDINAVCRSYSLPAWEAADPLAAAGIGQLLATAGDDGRVRLLSYPCVVDDAPARVYPGHSSHVMNVRFSPHNKWVASVGGKDRAVFQWRLQLQPRQQEAQAAAPLPEVFMYPARQKRLLQDATASVAPAAKEFVPVAPAPPPPPAQHVYEVTTVTSDIRAAGTDCGVFIILYGSGGHSGELKLENHPSNFSRGRTDSFTLTLPLDLGQLQRLRIGHDSKGSLPRWHLGHVVVTKKDGSMAPPVTFPCGAWFAKDEGDGATARVLLPGSLDGSGVSSSAAADPKQPRLYKLEVKTSDVRGAGTDANVTVTFIGTAGSSGPHKLESSKNDFERGSCCCFKLDAAVGELQALRIGHDNSGLGPTWHLQEVLVSSAGMAPLQFVANRWLAVDELDCSTYVTLTASGGKAAPTTKYMIQVYTNDLRGAGTDARVFVRLEGQGGRDSGPLRLENSKNNFERGAQDVFHVELPDLGELAAVEVGHDNSGAAPGWHLEQVVVVDEGTGKRWSFSCDRWLAKGEDDGLIKRRLLPSAASAAATYLVTTYTSDVRGAGTDAAVWLELMGELEGRATQSPRLPLDNSSNNFERGAVDSFLLKKQRCLGKLTAVRIGHDNKGMAPGWHLDHVEVVDDASGTTYYFPCRAWLDKKEGDGATERLLKAASEEDVASAAKLPYKVVVTTSDIKFAGTDANVFIEICGERDGKFTSSGRVPLNSSANNLERGAIDTFNLMLPNLGSISKILIGHDNAGAGAAWHLASVEVVSISSCQSLMFHHNGWLSRSDPPYKTEVELLPVAAGGSNGQGLCRYSIVVYTSDIRGAGTDANVSCVIGGDKGSTPRLSLENAANNFERGARDEFSVQSADVGQPTTLQIAHDNRGAAPAWHLSHVEVSNHATGARAVFYANAWLDVKLGTATLLLKAGGADGQGAAQNKWKLSVQTSDVRGAGTDADISAILVGEQGSSKEMRLESSADNFERGKVDEFVLDLGTTDVGPKLLQLDIGFASKSSAAGALSGLLGQSWALGSVEAMHMASGARQLFVHNGWLDKAQRRVTLLPRDLGDKASIDEKPLQYEVVVYTSDVRGAGTDADISIELHGEKGSSPALRLETSANNFERGQRDTFCVAAADLGALSHVVVAKQGGGLAGDWHLQMVEVLHPGLQQRFQFPFNDWLKGSSVRQEIRAAGAPGSSDAAAAAAGRVNFRVAVTTSDVRGAGTDANVALVLYGEKGDTGERKLESSANDFERGKTDTFFVRSPDIGPVHSLRISHDSSGLGPAWHLARIKVTNTSSGQALLFPYNGWLDDKHGCSQLLWPDRDGDGKGDAATHGSGTAASPEVKYAVTVYTSAVRNAGTSANVFCELHGSKGTLGACRLENASENFSRGRKDVFAVRGSDIGELQQLLLWHDGSGLSPDWHVQQVEVQHPLLQKQWILLCGKWLGKSQAQQAAAAAASKVAGSDAPEAKAAAAAAAAKAVGVPQGCLVILAPGADVGAGNAAGSQGPRLVSYKVEVQTSDIRGAGTDADVLLTIFGSAGDSGPQKLFTSANDFERGKLDTFFVQAPDVGSISIIQLQCQGGGLTAAWHLGSVTVTNSASGQVAKFVHNEWFDKSKGWAKVLQLQPQEAAAVPAPASADKAANGSSSSSAAASQPPEAPQLVEYVVAVTTGTALGAGTDGDVFLALSGERGTLGERQLTSSSTHMNKFERGNTDEFPFQGADVGALQSATVRLVERGVGAAWQLARIEVTRPDNGSSTLFLHDGWLAQTKDNPAGQVTLKVQQQPGQHQPQKQPAEPMQPQRVQSPSQQQQQQQQQQQIMAPLPQQQSRPAAAAPEPSCAWQRCSRPHPDDPAYEVVFYHNSSTGVSQYEAPAEYLEWQVTHQAWQQQQQKT